MQRLRTALVGAAGACLVLPLGIGSAVAHEDDGVLDVEVLVTGLDSPRGMGLDQRGNVWVAQSGRGGDGPCFAGPEGGDSCLGATGKVSVLVEDGRHWRPGVRGVDRDRDGWFVHDVVTGLPSVAAQGTGENAIGPSDIAFDRGRKALVTIGLGADPDVRSEDLGGSDLAGMLGTVVRVDTRTGATSPFADIGTFEAGPDNPEDEDEDSNPHSIAVGGGHRFVADAGGNALLELSRHGQVSTRYVFPKEAPVQVPGQPDGVTFPPADAVPNTVVQGPDGAFYVGQLTGFPFAPGTATVWRFGHGEEPTVYADGFTNIIDLAFDDDGNLLVLEIAHEGLLTAFTTGDWTGALIRVSADDPSEHTVLLTDPLFAPGGLVVDDDEVFISNHSTEPGQGQILRVELDD